MESPELSEFQVEELWILSLDMRTRYNFIPTEHFLSRAERVMSCRELRAFYLGLNLKLQENKEQSCWDK